MKFVHRILYQLINLYIKHRELHKIFDPPISFFKKKKKSYELRGMWNLKKPFAVWQFLHNSLPWYPNWQHKQTPPNNWWILLLLLLVILITREGLDSAVFANDNRAGCSRDWNGASPMESSKLMFLSSWSCRWSSSVVVPLLVQLDLASWSSAWLWVVMLSVLGCNNFGVADNLARLLVVVMLAFLLTRLISATGRAGGEAFLKSKREETAAAVSLRGRWVWGSRPRLISLRLIWVFQ